MTSDDDNLELRSKLALAEADEILRRGGPASYIILIMEGALNWVRYGHDGYSFFNMTKKEIQNAEQEATKAGMNKDIRRVLIDGYESIITACRRQCPYYNDYYSRVYSRFIDKCKKRIKELKKTKRT